jgi:CubicO group peptidase (beta-lactamase class C family)
VLEDALLPRVSSTKGVASMAAAVAQPRADRLRRARRWLPAEFAAAGEERVTVRQLLSHQVGPCATARYGCLG